MTRIIGGKAGGRRLQTPQGSNTRPTSDRVREALLSAIESWCGSLQGLAVLDLYAGSGAVGLEAWSRGATTIRLVESDRKTAALISTNARDLNATGVTVTATSVASALAAPAPTAYDIVFADPPYPLADDAVNADLAVLVENGWLAEDALVIIERAKRSPEPVWPDGLRLQRQRKYGETTLWFATNAPADDTDD